MHFFEFLFILTQEDKNLFDPSSSDVTVPHAVTHICLHICNSVTRIFNHNSDSVIDSHNTQRKGITT